MMNNAHFSLNILRRSKNVTFSIGVKSVLGGVTPLPTRFIHAPMLIQMGDALGDVEGIRSRLPYLKELGIECDLDFTLVIHHLNTIMGMTLPDYMDIEPDWRNSCPSRAGWLKKQNDLGIKLIVDIVPNHTSSDHKWFQAALKAGPGSPERNRYMFRDGKGANGDCHLITGKQSLAVVHGSALLKLMENQGSGIYIFLLLNNLTLTGRTQK